MKRRMMSDENFEPVIIAFCCQYCSYSAADLAGSMRLQYPPNIRIIRVPCSGRVDPLLIVKSFQMGADGVLIAGCHPGDCHYTEGNYYARRRFALLRPFLEYLGIESARFQVEWVSASEGKRWAQVVTSFTNQVAQLGPRKLLVPEATR